MLYSDYYTGDKILGRNVFCIAGRVFKNKCIFLTGLRNNVDFFYFISFEVSSRTVTESRPSCYLHGSDRQWHIFNLFSNHVRLNKVQHYFVLDSSQSAVVFV